MSDLQNNTLRFEMQLGMLIQGHMLDLLRVSRQRLPSSLSHADKYPEKHVKEKKKISRDGHGPLTIHPRCNMHRQVPELFLNLN